MPLHRSRSGRAIPPGAEGPLREPFSAGPFRQRTTSSPSTTPARKGRQYGENQPPENVNIAKGNNLEGASPALLKSASKKAKGHLVSPALPPMPPSAKASPAQVWQQPTSATLLDTSAKRKLNWEAQAASASEFAPVLDQTAAATPIAEANVDDNGVKVIVRVRPLTHREQQEGEIEALCVSSQTISLSQQMFTFDAVAGSDATQNDIFNMVGIPMVNHCIAGFNSSIFAYGQTGSGKTYTMWGPTQDNSNVSPNQSRGIAPRLFEHLFSKIEEEERRHSASQLRYQCRCSFLEIYNEQITDLLEPSQKNLQIREDTRTGVYVENLTEEFVSGVNDITELLLKGLANRSVGSTMMNNESSRSHSVFTCIIECRCKSLEHGVSSLRSSRMNLVDLAGSERQKLTGAAGERLKEAGNINRSLSQLGNVINILAEVAQSGKQRHIPYRDSRLTFLLQESLGGNAKLAMICSISTANSCKSETLSTLRFAKRAKAIQNKAVVNEETENDVNLLREQIRQLKEELMRMKSSSAERPSGWNPRRSYNLLRMSLNYPLALPKDDLESDSDEEMEIEDATPGDPRGQEGGSSNDVHVQCSELGSSKDVFDATRMMRLKDDDVEVPACPEVLCEGPVSATEVHTADSFVVEDMMQLDDDDEDVEVPAFQEVASEVVGTAGAAIERETADSLLVEEMMQLEEDDAEGPACPEAGCKCKEIAGAHDEVETAIVVEQNMQLEDDDALRPACPEAMHERLGGAGAAIPQEMIELETASAEAQVSEGHESAEVALSEDDAATDQVWNELGRSGHALVSEQMVDLKDDPSYVTASEKVEDDDALRPACPEAMHERLGGAGAAIPQEMIELETASAEAQVSEGHESAEVALSEDDAATDQVWNELGRSGHALVSEQMVDLKDDPSYVTASEKVARKGPEIAEDAHVEEEGCDGLVVQHMIPMEDGDPEEPAYQEAFCEGSECASAANTTEAAYGSIVEQMVNLEGDDAEDAHGEEEGPNGLVVQHMIQMEDVDPEEPACQEALCEGSECASAANTTEAAYGSIVEQMVNLEGDDAEDTHGEEEGPNGPDVQHMIQMEDADREEPACQEALCEGSECASAANATEAAYGSIVEQMRNLEGDDAVVDGGAAVELEAACAKAPVIEVQETAKTVRPEDYVATGQVFPELGRPTNGLVVENLLQLKDEFADVSVSQTTAVPEVAGAHVEEESASGLVTEQIVKMEDGIPEVPECHQAFFEGAECASAAHHGFEAAYGPVVEQMLNLEGNVCQDTLCEGPTIAGASIPQQVIEIETICIESQVTEGQEILKVTLSEHFEQEQGIVATSAVCPDPGKLVDGSIVKEMHLEDDAVVAAACPVSGRHETAQLTILQQAVQNQDDSGSVCLEVGGADLQLDRGGVSKMDDDSAKSLVHQEPESADCAIRDQTTAVDVGSPFLDESPRRLPCHTDCAGVWSYKVAESQPYYDCMSVFGSCTRFSLDSVREMVPSSPPGPRPEHLPDVNEDSLPVTPTTEQLRTCNEMLPVTEDSTAKKAAEESPAKDSTAVSGEPFGESDLLSVVVQAAPTRLVMPASPSGNGKRSHEVAACGESTAVPTLEPSYNQTRPKAQLTKAVEALLAGAIRREEAAEEKVRKQAAEIEQLNRLVRQYKHERECNAILQQSREDKIARLEILMDGVLPSDAFLTHEWAALTNEHQVLLDKYDNHPEVTHSLIQQQRVLEELREYRDFFDLGEKEEMQKEIRQLRKKLQDFLESGPPARPLDSRRRSMLMQSISVRQSMSVRHSVGLRGSVADRSALALCPDPKRFEENSDTLCDDLSMVVSDLFYPESKKARLQEEQAVEEAGFDGSLSPVGESSIVATECMPSRDKEWEERENDWIAVLEEIRLEADSYRRQAEMRTHELECERRCSEEAREALQMAVAGHARLLEQYAELQEKHISVLAKHRKIREGASDVKKMAKRAGISQLDSRWLETQATKMAVMEADHEEERQSMRHEIESLRAQLNDTADAVQAAGELLVRLKESEEAVSIAQDAALLAEQDAVALQRELEKAKRKHATEIAVLQQRVLESRLQKSTLCQMCAMAERVKFEFQEVDEETAQADMESEREAAALNVDRLAGTGQESIEEEHWVLSPIRYAQNADDWDYQSPVRDHDPAAQSRYDYYIDDYEKGWRR